MMSVKRQRLFWYIWVSLQHHLLCISASLSHLAALVTSVDVLMKRPRWALSLTFSLSSGHVLPKLSQTCPVVFIRAFGQKLWINFDCIWQGSLQGLLFNLGCTCLVKLLPRKTVTTQFFYIIWHKLCLDSWVTFHLKTYLPWFSVTSSKGRVGLCNSGLLTLRVCLIWATPWRTLEATSLTSRYIIIKAKEVMNVGWHVSNKDIVTDIQEKCR